MTRKWLYTTPQHINAFLYDYINGGFCPKAARFDGRWVWVKVRFLSSIATFKNSLSTFYFRNTKIVAHPLYSSYISDLNDPSPISLNPYRPIMRIITFFAFGLTSLSLICTGLIGLGGLDSKFPQLYLIKVSAREEAVYNILNLTLGRCIQTFRRCLSGLSKLRQPYRCLELRSCRLLYSILMVVLRRFKQLLR